MGINVSCITHLEIDSSVKMAGWERALNNSSYFVAISNFTYQQALSMGVEKNRISLIQYGVDPKYQPRLNVLVIGSASKRKGYDFFSDLRAMLKESTDICWKSASEKDWGLETLCENATELQLAYSWADLIVVTSEIEGAHTGTLEALFMGVKVLTRPVGWSNHELRNYVEIYETPIEMAKRINELKDLKIKGTSNQNYQLTEEGFSYELWRASHLDLFNKLIKNDI